MDYEKKYKDLYSRLKKVFNTTKSQEVVDMMYDNFREELYESEDERIRRQLIHAIKIGHYNGISFTEEAANRYIAWLEKQKEQKPAEDWKETRKKECPFRRKLDNNLYGCEQYADVFCECNGNCSWVVDYPKLKEIQDRKEQKPTEWSEEDEKMMKDIDLALRKLYDASTRLRIETRLKSLRPQPKQNANDMITPNKKFFQWIYDRLVNVHKENPNVDYMISFKERIEELWFDEPHWKPSEEQMEALDEYIYAKYPDTEKYGKTILSLREQLKKLM